MAEILVVVAILALLASITVYAIGKARKGADKQRLAFQFQTIAAGLEAYQTEFNSYPITSSYPTGTPNTSPRYYIDQEGVRGARLLCKALMGQTGGMNPVLTGTPPQNFPLDKAHQDGKTGLGFSVPGRSGITVTADAEGNLKGKSYGPYLAADKFPIANSDDKGNVINTSTQQPIPSLVAGEKYDDTAVLLDGNGNPILYFPCLNPQAPIGVTFGYISAGHTTKDATSPLETPTGAAFAGTSMYSGRDNSCWISGPDLRKLMGDIGDPATAGTRGDGKLVGPEVAPVRGKYILWSSGPDGLFGPNTKNGSLTFDEAVKRADLYDDVTNFQGQ